LSKGCSMDLIEQLISRFLALARVDSDNATKFLSTVMHSLIVYLLLVCSGIALFAPSSPFILTAIPIAVGLLLGSLLGISEWSDRQISKTTKMNLPEELISILISSISVYLTVVGVTMCVLIGFGIISQISFELVCIFVFVTAFLVYTLSDLPKLFEKRGS